MEGLFKAGIIFGIIAFCVCVSSLKESSSVVTKTTLTTAKLRGNASPKPTIAYRRINVEPVENFSTTPFNLLQVNGPQRRGHVDNLFEWDFWCQSQPKSGKCTGKKQGPMTQNYYYDAQQDTCKTFYFSGCGGNKNNFQTLVECERHCKGSIYMTLKDAARSTYCELQPSAGTCMAFLQRYYYDVGAKECKTFVYGGCGGNQNRFDTHELCNKRCNNK